MSNPAYTGLTKFAMNFNPNQRRFPWQKVFSSAQQGAQQVMPYLSNIVNTFRKPPMPTAPKLVSYVRPRRVSYADQYGEVDRQIRGANLGADQSLDANTAAAVKMGNLAQGIRAKNSISTAESNANASLGAQSDQLNAGIQLQNTAMQNGYQNELTERQVAQQRAQSENLANATDKYVAEQNEKAKADLDLQKLNVYKQLWQNSGVYDRLLGTMKKQGINLPGITDEDQKKTGGYLYRKGGYMKVYGEGGTVSRAAVNHYTPWGSLAGTVQKEGWMATPLKDYTEYTPNYEAAGKHVMIDGKPTGGIVVRGGNNGLFDVIIRDNAGNHPDNFLMKGVDANTAHGYFVNSGSTVDQRVDQVKQGIAKYGSGGSIHIAPSKRGTFTAAATRHGKGVQAFASQVLAHKGNYSPAMVKKANFARNASHFKHAYGGSLKKVY